MKFLHIADIHLGYRQYNSQQRFEDFGFAFELAIDMALEEAVHAVLIAGDLFHKSSINPATLLQAETQLKRLEDQSIQCLVIAGNHDRPRFGQQTTWLDYLEKRKLITLLETFTDGQFVVENQSYVDIDGVRIIGMPWYGGSTSLVVEKIAEELPHLNWDDIRYTVMMAHTGIEGQMLDMPDVLRYSQINPLREYIDYLALGHLHKPYTAPQDNPWIYNPGAIENNTFDEAKFTDKGVLIVEVEQDHQANIQKQVIPGRPFRSFNFPITKYGTYETLVEQLHDELKKKNREWSKVYEPVVNFTLTGTLKFDRSRLNLEKLRQLAEDTLDCLLVRIHTRLDNLKIVGDYDEELTAEQLEREVFTDIAREKGYGDDSFHWATTMRHVKQMALRKDAPEDIYQMIVNHLNRMMEDNN